jgi:hypothetical protein
VQPRFQIRFGVDAWPCRIRKLVFFFYDHSPDAECGTTSRYFVVGLLVTTHPSDFGSRSPCTVRATADRFPYQSVSS